MKILIKGGVWKNTEDEILKAAVMKYGKNQWARVASLLSRKSAAQCKARWYEWLDPNIKKTEWTKEEEEKLLILAKTLPMQWRTIAPLVGRTPMQCLEHYDKLIDKAMGRNDTENIRLLRPGEIDPNPETKPARPDPIDMDDDEKEMLSEARARLASTKGKKAKRKAREKQMEEAKRLSTTQKRRELKAAGIDIRYKQYKKKRELDNYNNEIPFARAIPAGVYDISEELKPQEMKPFQPVTVAELEDRNRDEEEIKAIERDKQRFKRLQQTNPIDAIMQINNVTSDQQLRKRRKLNLPDPVLNDLQLIEMVKSGSQNEVLRSGNQLTSGLLGAGSTPSTLRPSIGRTPLRSDILMQEARNIAKIQELQTPLLPRQEIKLEAGLNKTGLTPLITNTTNILQAQNQVLTPYQVNATPFRDNLGLNDKEWDNRTNNQNKISKLQIENQLNNLPAPQNEYTLKTPILPKSVAEEIPEEDAEITNRIRLIEQARLEELEYNRRSQVLKRDLPRPSQLNTEKILLLEDNKSIDYMILEETVSLILEDNKNYPIKITKNSISTKDFIKHLYTDEELSVAKSLIDSEIDDIKTLMTECYGELNYQDFVSFWTQHNNRIIYLSGKKSFAFIDKLPQSDIIQSNQYLFNMFKSEMEILTKKIQKLENIVNILLQGYIKLNENLNKELSDLFTEYDNKIIELKCYQQLMSMEDQAMTIRKTIIDGDLKEQKEKEHILQQRYTELLREKDAIFRS